MTHKLSEFPIVSLSREDLETAGFDASAVNDDTMTRLAGKMADEFIGEFLNTLEMLGERFDIPKRKFPHEDAVK